MNDNKENKSLSVSKPSIFERISIFFKNIFHKKTSEVLEKTEVSRSKENFWKNIKIEEEQEDEVILELQRKIRIKEISVNDLSDDEMDRLVALYNRQIERINRKTEEVIAETDIINMKIARLKNLKQE